MVGGGLCFKSLYQSSIKNAGRERVESGDGACIIEGPQRGRRYVVALYRDRAQAAGKPFCELPGRQASSAAVGLCLPATQRPHRGRTRTEE